MITIEATCYKYKPLKNGELPLKIKVCKDRKTRYINLGVSTKAENWDFPKNRLKNTSPNKDKIENLITCTISKLREKIVELKTLQQDFTAQTLIDKLNVNDTRKRVADVFNEQIQRLCDENRQKYMQY